MIAGGGGILGPWFVAALAESGADIIVVDMDEVRAKQVAEDAQKAFGIKALGVECDISKPEDVNRMVVDVRQDFKHVDILLNAAATKTKSLKNYLAPLEDYDLDTWNEIMATNIGGMFLMAQSVGKWMIDSGVKGSIIQIASIYGILGPKDRIYEGSEYEGMPISTSPAYPASKGAVIAWTRYLATAWAKHGIRVNTITPGGVESGQNDEFKARYGKEVPLGRMAEASEMAGALVYLASDASSYMTGQNLVVDGGLTVW